MYLGSSDRLVTNKRGPQSTTLNGCSSWNSQSLLCRTLNTQLSDRSDVAVGMQVGPSLPLLLLYLRSVQSWPLIFEPPANMTEWNDATKYMRIVALSWYSYDWILTAPAEIRLYRRQSSIFHLSTACTLLILVRYLGLVALLLNFVGFFSHEFTTKSCSPYWRIMPITQCLASWASHAVFVVRTLAICNNGLRHAVFLSALGIIVSGLELFAQLYSFRKFKAGTSGNCLIQYSDDVNISWVYYLVSLVFDAAILGMTYRGLAISFANKQNLRSGFSDVLWHSSMRYFGATTILNALNLSFYAYYQNSSNSTILCAMGIALTSMMSSRVILDLHSYANRPMSTFQLTGLPASDPSQDSSDFVQTPSFTSPHVATLTSSASPHITSLPPIGEDARKHERRINMAPWEAPWEAHWQTKTVV